MGPTTRITIFSPESDAAVSVPYCCRTLQAALLLQVTKPLLLSFFSS